MSINFVHDRRSFEHMEAIRAALGKPIVRVDTSDFEQMEKVRPRSCPRLAVSLTLPSRRSLSQTLKAALKS